VGSGGGREQFLRVGQLLADLVLIHMPILPPLRLSHSGHPRPALADHPLVIAA
jgi:hypothetical protein